MANHASAQKSIRQTLKRKLINKSRKSKIKTYLDKVKSTIQKGTPAEAQEALRVAQSETMRGVTKKVIKLKSASRKIKKLAHKLKNMQSNTEGSQDSTVLL